MPLLDPQFVDLLCCPVSRLPLRERTLNQLATLGLTPDQYAGWDAGLLRGDGRGVYPLRGGIPILLAEALVPLDSEATSAPHRPAA